MLSILGNQLLFSSIFQDIEQLTRPVQTNIASKDISVELRHIIDGIKGEPPTPTGTVQLIDHISLRHHRIQEVTPHRSFIQTCFWLYQIPKPFQ
jgi:hypothetical protein